MPRRFTTKTVPWVIGSGNNFAVKRQWFLNVGGCDERLGPGSPGLGGVDMDLFYRLARARAEIRYVPESVVYHERQNKEGRIARRWMYGHGMAACCGLWLRQHDFYALRMLGHWFGFRACLLARAAFHREWRSVYEEGIVLVSSLAGLKYGWRSGRPA